MGTAPIPEPAPSADTRSSLPEDEAAGATARSADRAVVFPAHPEIWSPLVSHLAGEVDLESVLGTGQSRPVAEDLDAGLTGATGTGPDSAARETDPTSMISTGLATDQPGRYRRGEGEGEGEP